MALTVVGMLAAGWFGWLVAAFTFESDAVSAASGLFLVGFPSFMSALAIARAQPRHKLVWFLALFLALSIASLLFMLVIVSLAD